MYFSNLLTFSLNVGRLIKITGARFKIFAQILIPTAAAFGITASMNTLLNKISDDLLFVAAYSGLSVILYVGFLVVFKIVDVREYV